jgi:hypothetical protein
MAMSGSSSGDDEAKGWGQTVRLALRFAAIIEDLRVAPLEVRGYVDNDSLRLACQRGSSPRMGHLRKTASLNFRLIKQVGMVPARVDSVDNLADFLTKVLSRDKIMHLLKTIFGLEVGRNEHGSIIVKGKKNGAVSVNFVKHESTCDAYPNVTDFGALLSNEALSIYMRSCLCRAWSGASDDHYSTLQCEDDLPAQLRIGLDRGWLRDNLLGPQVNP